MTLFQRAAPNRRLFEFDFQRVLDKYYNGAPHDETNKWMDLAESSDKTSTDTEDTGSDSNSQTENSLKKKV
jgi:hypothetical protein